MTPFALVTPPGVVVALAEDDDGLDAAEAAVRLGGGIAARDAYQGTAHGSLRVLRMRLDDPADPHTATAMQDLAHALSHRGVAPYLDAFVPQATARAEVTVLLRVRIPGGEVIHSWRVLGMALAGRSLALEGYPRRSWRVR